MTTKIEDIYNAIIAKTAGALTDYRRIADPYFAPSNPDQLLDRGFGIAINDGVNLNLQISCRYSWLRTFQILLTNRITARENDSSRRGQGEINLINSREQLFLAFRQDVTLGGICIDCDFTGDSGIVYLEGVNSRHLAMTVDLDVRYEDNI